MTTARSPPLWASGSRRSPGGSPTHWTQKALERAARDYRAESHQLLDAVVDANLDLAGTPGNGNLLVRTIETRARMEGLMAAPVPQPRAAAEEWQVVIADFETGEMVDSATGEVITPARKAITE
jgi:hypothetical protein